MIAFVDVLGDEIAKTATMRRLCTRLVHFLRHCLIGRNELP
jgi:hypothetical protein